MKSLPVLFGILVAETGIANYENSVWSKGYATSDSDDDAFFILKRLLFFFHYFTHTLLYYIFIYQDMNGMLKADIAISIAQHLVVFAWKRCYAMN